MTYTSRKGHSKMNQRRRLNDLSFLVNNRFFQLCVFGLMVINCTTHELGTPIEPTSENENTNENINFDATNEIETIELLRRVGDQQILAQREAVEALLTSENTKIFFAAVGTLVQLGDTRSVVAILSAINPRNHQKILDVMPAIADLGGEEANIFLQTMQSHDNARIRARAYALSSEK